MLSRIFAICIRSGEESTNQAKLEEGFVIGNVDSKPKYKACKLIANTAILVPLEDQHIPKRKLSCPETLSNENIKLVLPLEYAKLEAGDVLHAVQQDTLLRIQVQANRHYTLGPFTRKRFQP